MRMFLAPGDEIIIPAPTFGMYSFSADVAGARAVSVPRTDNFDIDVEAIRRAITPRAKAVFFPSPNNPTGNLVTEAQARALLDTGLLVVADEAYYDFCGQTLMPLLTEYRNLVVLRTFSKWAGLAGLRIGAGAMDAELAATMMGMKAPLQCQPGRRSGPAGLAGRPGASPGTGWTPLCGNAPGCTGCSAQSPGIVVWPSEANFILCKMPDGRGREIYEAYVPAGRVPALL